MSDSPLQRLKALGIELPPPPVALASYVPAIVVPAWDGRVLVYVSGQVHHRNGVAVDRGRVPAEVSLEQACANARACAVNVLAQLEHAVGLEQLEQVLQVTIWVACDPGFDQHPVVGNGASDLFVDVLGERGRHSRAAVGATSLPLGVPVEVAAVALARTRS